jgi:predicted nucleic acid-binding protein
MNLPANDDLYIDANFLIAYFVNDHGDHKNSKKLLAYFLIKQDILNFSPLTLDELMMGVYKELNKAKNKIGKNRGLSVADFYPELKVALELLLNNSQFRLRQFENNLNNSCILALENIKNFTLRPRDAFHVSYMQDWSINKIISRDSDFDKLKGINIERINF